MRSSIVFSLACSIQSYFYSEGISCCEEEAICFLLIMVTDIQIWNYCFFLGKGLNLNRSRIVWFVNVRNSLDRLGDFVSCVTQVFVMCAATFCGAWAWDP